MCVCIDSTSYAGHWQAKRIGSAYISVNCGWQCPLVLFTLRRLFGRTILSLCCIECLCKFAKIRLTVMPVEEHRQYNVLIANCRSFDPVKLLARSIDLFLECHYKP